MVEHEARDTPMSILFRISGAWVFLIAVAPSAAFAQAQPGESTRVVDANQHARTGPERYPYREKADYIFRELDLRPGDVVVDIGAGDGWWSERMLPFVGNEGVLHAAEIDEEKVKTMQQKFAHMPQIKPYLCKPDGTLLPENSCDLAFFSQSYHHLEPGGQVDYLKHLREVVKPTGRLCVIEKNAAIATEARAHATHLGELIDQAEAAGWIALRTELMPGTYHYLAIFAQKDLFPPEPIVHTSDSLDTVRERIAQKQAVLIDVREQNEWDAGHLADATLVPLSLLREKGPSPELAHKLRGKLPKDKTVYCHCRSGSRVLRATPILRELGYDIRPLKAGYEDLLKAGFPKAE